MRRLVLSALAIFVLGGAFPIQSQSQQPANTGSGESAPSMPSTEEINDLLSKASEYVTTYREAFKNAKPTLDKSPTRGFNQHADELCSQATSIIAAVKKNGPTAYALVALVGVLDDMSLNAARASATTVIVGLQEGAGNEKTTALEDMQNLAQAEKNCYDISELILHSTLRLIAVEEQILSSAANSKRK